MRTKQKRVVNREAVQQLEDIVGRLVAFRNNYKRHDVQHFNATRVLSDVRDMLKDERAGWTD